MEIPFEIIEDSSKKKKRIELSYYSAILLLGIYLKNTKILIWKDICTHIVNCSIVYNSQAMEAT